MKKVTDQIFNETPGGERKAESGSAGYVDSRGFWHPAGQTLIRVGGARRTARDWDPFAVGGNWDPFSAKWPPKKF